MKPNNVRSVSITLLPIAMRPKRGFNRASVVSTMTWPFCLAFLHPVSIRQTINPRTTIYGIVSFGFPIMLRYLMLIGDIRSFSF